MARDWLDRVSLKIETHPWTINLSQNTQLNQIQEARSKMQQFQLSDHVTPEVLGDFYRYMQVASWNYGVPGGFVTNCPQRKVNAYGTGAPINQNGEVSGPGWSSTYWTPKMSQSNMTLHTATTEIPPPLRQLIPTLRSLFLRVFPDAALTENTFSIAVCNYYTDPEMYIAAHTDDNQWYPHECRQGPVFASLTLYPEGEPTDPDAFARFQVRQDGVWTPVKLPHGSVLIMPSGLEHRVLAHTKRQRHLFRPRINITFRSTYPRSVNPLMNAMAVANHTRYYRLPYAISYPSSLPGELVETISRAYDESNRRHGAPALTRLALGGSGPKQRRQQVKQQYSQLSLARGYQPVTMGTNMVPELIKMVVSSLTAD